MTNIKIGNSFDCDLTLSLQPIQFLRVGRWEVAAERFDSAPMQYGLRRMGAGEWEWDMRRWRFLITDNGARKTASTA